MQKMRRVVLYLCLMLLFIIWGNDEAYAAEDVAGFEKAVVSAITNRQNEASEVVVDIRDYNITEKNIYKYYYALSYKNPYIFVAKWTHLTPVDGKVYSMRFKYNYTAAQTKVFYEKFNAEVNKVVAAASKMTELEKVLYVHDYISSNISYDYDAYLKYAAGNKSAIPDEHYTAVGVMVNKTGVCLGYALAAKYLLNKLGVVAEVVESDSMNHAWNIVKIGGYYYHMDSTWDDPAYDTTGKVSHKYFLVSDSKIQALGYKGYRETNPSLPYAKSTKFDNYFWRGVTSAFTYYGGYWYYVNANGVICRYNFKTASNQGILSLPDKRWNVVGNNNSYYQGIFSTFRVYNGNLYFNTKSKIYKLDVANKRAIVAVSPSTKSGYIYGLGSVNDKLVYQIKTKPSAKGALYSTSQTVVLSVSNYFTANVVCSQRALSSCKVAVSSAEYTGSNVTPAIVIKYGTYTLVRNRDYILTLSNNKNFGKGKVVIKGIGNYAGTLTKYFNITIGKVKSLKTAARTKSSIKLSWGSVKGASYYQVYQYNSKTKKYVYVGKTTARTFVRKGLSKRTTYYYKVRAVRSGSVGAFSATLKTNTSR